MITAKEINDLSPITLKGVKQALRDIESRIISARALGSACCIYSSSVPLDVKRTLEGFGYSVKVIKHR